ncbi:hypothetical protein CBG25_05800 [Arsenophonus sp. ENCA]|uniref:hypothetical protein n=1 Tax=Arsenophonus sp. ENCA TaxID=1987579 RepID=UPI000BD3AD48|nr:hypothetical protein [Arsenophonus sp. ENCA]PAV06483.1 hypothetical protein CBG25_05800 [Arsenophonus sp. ENCA]
MGKTLSDYHEEYQELYNQYDSIVKKQLSISMDSIRAKKYWQEILPSADLSVLADVLANALYLPVMKY